MKTATETDKELVIDILCASFKDNKSVHFILPEKSRDKRIRNLMFYAFEQCFSDGIILINEELNGCALLLERIKTKISIKSIIRDLKFIFQGIGLLRLYPVLKRQSIIKSNYPRYKNYIYLWFIGIKPPYQNKGLGTNLLEKIIEIASKRQLPILLETSMEDNFTWYTKSGFDHYHTIQAPQKLYFFKKD